MRLGRWLWRSWLGLCSVLFGVWHTRLHRWQLTLIFVNFDCKISWRLNRNHLTNSECSQCVCAWVCVYKLIALGWWVLHCFSLSGYLSLSLSIFFSVAHMCCLLCAHARISFNRLMARTDDGAGQTDTEGRDEDMCVCSKYSQMDCVNKSEIMALSSNMPCSPVPSSSSR